MKRSSSIAALDDTIDVQDYESSFEDHVLVTSMMLVTIEEESRRNKLLLRNNGLNGSMGSISATSSFSRSNSGGSLRGWGSSSSRKSYKVDLCSLVADDETPASDLTLSKERRKLSSVIAFPKSGSSGTSETVTNHSLESWGFFSV